MYNGSGECKMSEESEEIGIKAEVERLTARVEALNEAREAFNERYSNMSEKIGELRSMIMANERDADEFKHMSKIYNKYKMP